MKETFNERYIHVNKSIGGTRTPDRVYGTMSALTERVMPAHMNLCKFCKAQTANKLVMLFIKTIIYHRI